MMNEPAPRSTPPAAPPANPAAPPAATPDSPPAPPLPLSREEQMARFEEALKEEDWGHQPC